MIVVDASLFADFLLGRAPALDAVAAAVRGREHEPLHAPGLIEPEILNALRGLVRSGGVSDHRATEATRDLARARLIRYPHGPLLDRALALRDELTAYDAMYLALAEALEEPTLLTGDDGLATVARRSLGDEHVWHVAA